MKKIFALFLIFVMCLSFCSCGQKATPENVAMNYVKAKEEYNSKNISKLRVISKDVENEATVKMLADKYRVVEEEARASIFQSASDEYGVEIKNFTDLSNAIAKQRKDNLIEYYGKNYSIKCEIKEIIDLEGEELENMISDAEEYYENMGIVLSEHVDVSKIKAGKKITVVAYFDGENIEEPEDKQYTITLGSVNGTWKVFTETVDSNNTKVGKPKDGTPLELTDEMIDEIEDEVWGNYYSNSCIIVYHRMYGDSVDITDFQKTAVRQTDEYTITVFGKLYFINNYGDNVYTNAQIVYGAEANSENESGYEITRDYKVDTD